MSELNGKAPMTRPGFEPPTDAKVHWLGWFMWPFVSIMALGVAAFVVKIIWKWVT